MIPDVHILLIGAGDADASRIGSMLAETGNPRFLIDLETGLDEGLNRLREPVHDLVLLNLTTPECNGRRTVEAVVGSAAPLPVVVLGGRDDPTIAGLSLRLGAQDYLVLEEIRHSTLVRTLVHAIERQRKVARLEQARREAEHNARHDPLTGLPTRGLFMDRAHQAIGFAERENREVGILFLDLDRFKEVNDRNGHEAGDRLLVMASERLASSLRGSDTVARVGGDEFLILAAGLPHARDAARLAESMVQIMARPYSLDDRTLRVTASVGVAVYPGHGLLPQTLARKADEAMYLAKRAGRGTFRLHPSGAAAAVPRRRRRGEDDRSSLWTA